MSNDLEEDGYPTEEALKKITDWPYEDPIGWFDFIYSLWAYDAWEKDDTAKQGIFDRPVIRFTISTCGWSGNESIICAMQENTVLWHFHCIQWRRGGHYIFEVHKEAS